MIPVVALPAVVILAGPPGSGKTRFRSQFPEHQVLCLDDYRMQATDDPNDQSADQIVSTVSDLFLKERVRRRRFTVIDACNARAAYRALPLAYAAAHFMHVITVFFDVPVAECLNRQAARGREVPRKVVQRIYDNLHKPDNLAALEQTSDIFVHINGDHPRIRCRAAAASPDLDQALKAVHGWLDAWDPTTPPGKTHEPVKDIGTPDPYDPVQHPQHRLMRSYTDLWTVGAQLLTWMTGDGGYILSGRPGPGQQLHHYPRRHDTTDQILAQWLGIDLEKLTQEKLDMQQQAEAARAARQARAAREQAAAPLHSPDPA